MKTRACFIHALSPLHAGTGQAADLIDLPIARLKGSGIPFLPGSSIKGVLRDAANEALSAGNNALSKDEFYAIFGPETKKASDHSGALVCMDARLLCLPVRSFFGAFAYVTSPLLLRLAARDLADSNPPAIRDLSERQIAVTAQSCLPTANQSIVYLEDLDLSVVADATAMAGKWAQALAKAIPTGKFENRFAIVSDDVMSFLWDTATQVDSRIRIEAETRTVADGALWLEESLPAETLLIGMLGAERSRRTKDENDAPLPALSATDVLAKVLDSETRILQFGGKATVGRGRCRLVPA